MGAITEGEAVPKRSRGEPVHALSALPCSADGRPGRRCTQLCCSSLDHRPKMRMREVHRDISRRATEWVEDYFCFEATDPRGLANRCRARRAPTRGSAKTVAGLSQHRRSCRRTAGALGKSIGPRRSPYLVRTPGPPYRALLRFAAPSSSLADGRPILIVPLTAYDYQTALQSWPRRFAKRLLGRPRLHLPLNPWKGWPSPKIYWDLVAQAADDQPACYFAFAIRTDAPSSARPPSAGR